MKTLFQPQLKFKKIKKIRSKIKNPLICGHYFRFWVEIPVFLSNIEFSELS
jgi:hypothetical protein